MNRSQRIRKFLLGVSLMMVFFLNACDGGATSLDSSAKAWFEYPFNGDILPMGPVTLVVYAADAGGVGSIQVTVNGEKLSLAPIASLAADGSTRLVRTDTVWQPTEEGEYIVEAVGVNSAGASGGSGTTRFCIVSCIPGKGSTPTPAGEEYLKEGSEEPKETVNDSESSTATPTPQESTEVATNTPTSAPPPAGKVDVEFYAHPATVDAGNCATLHWDASGATNIYLDEVSAWEVGSQESCPCQNETHSLQVTQPDGSSEDYYATISVNGTCDSGGFDTPTLEAPPPADISGPSISSLSTYWDGCSLYGNAYITDPSGVSWAEFWFNLNGSGWAWAQMNPGGDTWVSQAGVDTISGSGTLEYKVRTLDTLNNESWSGVSSRNFSYCGE
ncbi:MAG: hypothetical protein GY755_25510 [Chloroflexi bacterium]|nr:hypothetical protein [Chloroflexota bacterium]